MVELSEPMLARARERLTVVAVLLGVVLNLLSLSALGWFVWSGDAATVRSQPVDLVSANLWLVLAVATRIRALSHVFVLRLGQLTIVASVLSLSFVDGMNEAAVGGHAHILTWSPLLIAIYPMIVPSPPRVTVTVVGLAALSAPLGVIGGSWVSGHPSLVDAVASTVAPAVAALIAVVGSDLIYRSTVDIGLLREQEALLQAVLVGVDEVIVLTDPDGREVFATGGELPVDVQAAPDGLVVGTSGPRTETWWVARKPIELRGRSHHLTVARRITAALDEAEVDSWRRLIRALSHELNNSLAPMSSLLHSVRLMLGRPEHRDRLSSAIDSLQGRVEHLAAFLSEYAAFARLPRPRPAAHDWSAVIGALRPLSAFAVEGALPATPGWFDRGQLEQVLLNLLKNAAESGGAPEQVSLSIAEADGGVSVVVVDRGAGISEEVAAQALVPFFSTKEEGTGLGLALSRDIVVAHGGWLTLAAREGGGAEVTVWLPGPP